MTTERLQGHVHAVPFQPFTLKLADGEELHVPHPDFITHAPNTRTAAISFSDGSIQFVDLLLVVSLVVGPPAHATPP
jgi:hypothetical protein